ncbi:MAG TPA: helix-turn-helix transcriptional regulator [Clostridia bacterium]|nr:helix-turn-helix transcriptional regulator [Clostridia bacterium]
MRINKIIRKKRLELGLTQKKVAEYLGVSTPAVNKWEKGVSYPDISLLPSLARLLKTDLNTLLSFKEELSEEEIGRFINELSSTIQKKGFEEGYSLAEEKIKEYPTSPKLIYTIALTLEGSLLVFENKDSEKYGRQIESLYKRLAHSDDSKIRDQAISKMISKYIKRAEYEKAQKLIDSLPEQGIDKGQIQTSLYIKQKKNIEAMKLLEEGLLEKINEIQGLLLKLAQVNQKEKKIEEADYIAKVFEKTARLYDLWDCSAYIANFELAVFTKDQEKSLALLKNIFEAMDRKWDINHSPLYRNIKTKKEAGRMGEFFLLSLIKEIEKNKKYEFLWKNKDYLDLIKRYSPRLSN